MQLQPSFEAMYRSEYPALIAVATALSGAGGEDMVQDAMVKALIRLPPAAPSRGAIAAGTVRRGDGVLVGGERAADPPENGSGIAICR